MIASIFHFPTGLKSPSPDSVQINLAELTATWIALISTAPVSDFFP
jgi:hypothetical protein